MHGIVLWINQKNKMALIWCEDHKGLATYSAPDTSVDMINLESGDLVEFDVIEPTGFQERKAINLRVSSPKMTTDLPERMVKAAPKPRVRSTVEFGESKVALTKK